MARNSPKSSVLDARHMQAATLLFEGMNATECAEAMGVDESTIRAWAKKPQWTAYMARLESEAVENTVARLRRLVGRATTRLEGILEKPGVDDGDTLRAVFGLYDRIGLGPHSFEHKDGPAMSVEEAEDQILKRADAIRERRGEKVGT